MDQATTLLLEISFAVGAVAMLCGYGFYWLKKPKHFLNILTPDDGVIPVRIKKLGGHIDWVDPTDKSKIRFILDQRFARHTKNGGLRFYADPKTGLLVRYVTDAGTFEHLDPKYLMRALNDGRIQQIARAAKGPALWEQYILPGIVVLGIVAIATLYMVYKMYTSARGGH